MLSGIGRRRNTILVHEIAEKLDGFDSVSICRSGDSYL